MDDLPKLPFEQILSYLSLRDRLRLSAVSRSCHQKIADSRVKNLCYSKHPRDFIHGKRRWASGAFAQNFINSTKFESFFGTYRRTVLSSLKHLHLCDLTLDLENGIAFNRTLNSFGELEELTIVRMKCYPERMFELNLPMLTKIHLEELTGTQKLTLDAPSLKKVRLLQSKELRLDIVHGESVERLITTNSLEHMPVSNLKNLQFLHIDYLPMLGSTFLSSLEQLKELHVNNFESIPTLFEHQQRYARDDLKVYFRGLLLSGPDDPVQNVRNTYSNTLDSALVHMVKNPSKLADEIPFNSNLFYWAIDQIASGSEFDVLKRLSNCNHVVVDRPVRDIQRFLDLLKKFPNLIELWFLVHQPQDLFDRLPEHCAVQTLKIGDVPSDLAFLSRLKHLIRFETHSSIDAKTVRKAFEELPVLSHIEFGRCAATPLITIETDGPRQFSKVSGMNGASSMTFFDLNAAIEFIFGKQTKQGRPKKRKAEELE